MGFRTRWRHAPLTLLFIATPALTGALGPRQAFDDRLLAAHNRERLAVGAAPLSWDPQLAASARRWAKHLAATNTFVHSNQPGSESEGENLWAGTAGFYQPERMVGLWAAEKRYYKVGVFPNNSSTGNVADVGHYTQLIWARTERVGCALAHGTEEDFLVCRYKRAGNVVGEAPI